MSIFSNSFTCKLGGKSVVKLSLKSPLHLTQFATLPCKILIPENWQQHRASIVINNKSQGSEATHLRCGGIFNNHFARNLVKSVSVKEFWKWLGPMMWLSYRHEFSVCLFGTQCRCQLNFNGSAPSEIQNTTEKLVGRPLQVTIRPMLRYRWPVCNVGVLWPNGWMDQDATWCASRHRTRRRC